MGTRKKRIKQSYMWEPLPFLNCSSNSNNEDKVDKPTNKPKKSRKEQKTPSKFKTLHVPTRDCLKGIGTWIVPYFPKGSRYVSKNDVTPEKTPSKRKRSSKKAACSISPKYNLNLINKYKALDITCIKSPIVLANMSNKNISSHVRGPVPDQIKTWPIERTPSGNSEKNQAEEEETRESDKMSSKTFSDPDVNLEYQSALLQIGLRSGMEQDETDLEKAAAANEFRFQDVNEMATTEEIVAADTPESEYGVSMKKKQMRQAIGKKRRQLF